MSKLGRPWGRIIKQSQRECAKRRVSNAIWGKIDVRSVFPGLSSLHPGGD